VQLRGIAVAAAALPRLTHAAEHLLPVTPVSQVIGKHGFRQWGIAPQFFQGWAEAHSGDPRRGEQRIRAALAEMYATETQWFRPFVLGLLAEAQLLAGNSAEAGDTLRRATEEADRLGQHLYDGQLRALQARLG
jgi:predicted ATPase